MGTHNFFFVVGSLRVRVPKFQVTPILRGRGVSQPLKIHFCSSLRILNTFYMIPMYIIEHEVYIFFFFIYYLVSFGIVYY